MPEVKGVGQLDWDFQIEHGEIQDLVAKLRPLDCDGTERLLTAIAHCGSPILLNHDKTVNTLSLSLALDKPLQIEHEQGTYLQDEGWWKLTPQSDYFLIENPGDKLKLPQRLMTVLEELYHSFKPALPFVLSYEYQPDLAVLNIGINFNPDPDACQKVKILRPQEYLSALARQMAQWYRESAVHK